MSTAPQPLQGCTIPAGGEKPLARFFWICLGGAIGTGARYLLSGWMLRVAGPGFPYGTLAVNVAGSFLLGLLMQVSLATDSFPPTLRVVLATGVMGGFTTYSAFNYETRSVLHTTQILRLSEDLPVVIEIVEASDRIERLLEMLDEMVPEGLVTLEKVRIVKYSPGTRPHA